MLANLTNCVRDTYWMRIESEIIGMYFLPNSLPISANADWCPPVISAPFAEMTRQTDLMSGHGKPSEVDPLLPLRFPLAWSTNQVNIYICFGRIIFKAKYILVSLAIDIFGCFLVQIFADTIEFLWRAQRIECQLFHVRLNQTIFGVYREYIVHQSLVSRPQSRTTSATTYTFTT